MKIDGTYDANQNFEHLPPRRRWHQTPKDLSYLTPRHNPLSFYEEAKEEIQIDMSSEINPMISPSSFAEEVMKKIQEEEEKQENAADIGRIGDNVTNNNVGEIINNTNFNSIDNKDYELIMYDSN